MDYEVYTIILNSDNEIVNTINHSNEETDFNIEEISQNILNNNNKDTLKINNLYFSNYSYNLKNNDSLIVMNTKNISERLINILLTSIIIFIIFEIIIIYIAYLITNWLIKPAIDSFQKQKDFIADASHELKTPLAVIMASADSLEKNPKETKYLDNIKSESDRMSKLIASLLDLSKLESGVNKDNYKLENLSKIIEKSTLTFESLAYENNTSIDADIEENIMFNCSNIEINELISILIDNAIKHSEKDIPIKVSLKKQKNEIILEVINKGSEISKDDCEKIFERFYRLDKSRNRDSNRYGLGLAIAKNIVINHGGIISASSNSGYTNFKVIFKNIKKIK